MKIKSEDIELYGIGILFLYLVWLIYHTVRYYKGEKRKVKYLHRFAKEGEVDSQTKLAQRYEKGDMVIQDCDRAAFWYQNAAFNGDEKSREQLRKFLDKREALKFSKMK